MKTHITKPRNQQFRKHSKNWLLSAFLYFLLLFAFGPTNQCIGQNVSIPDANFKAKLLSNPAINTNGDGEIQTAEASAYNGIIVVNNSGIANLTGIDAFTAITRLECSSNNLPSLNVSSNIALKALVCEKNKLTSLNVSGCSGLLELYCSDNLLTSINVSSNPLLTILYCSKNQLSSLDVSSNPSLNDLFCFENYLTSLDVSANHALTTLYCNHNNLTSLIVTGASMLTHLNCHQNSLSTLNVLNNPALLELSCFLNNLSTLNLSGNPSLTLLDCKQNSLTSINVGSNVLLRDLICNNNQLSSLALSNNTALYNLNCSFNNLLGLSVSNNPALYTLNCSNNKLTSLDILANTALYDLDCNNNSISSMDLSLSVALSRLNCAGNKLANLSVTANPGVLAYLDCRNNILNTLDVSACTSLVQLFCSNNNLTSLDVSSNPGLILLYCSDNKLIKLNVLGNPNLVDIDCHKNNLPGLNLAANKLLTDLDCSQNKLSRLSVSTSKVLTTLNCSENSLTFLNLSFNTLLTTLFCQQNRIDRLDVSGNPNLDYLYCFNNNLTRLTVKNGNNTNFIDFNAVNNPNLSCIEVDNPAYATANWLKKDAKASYSLNCNYCSTTSSVTSLSICRSALPFTWNGETFYTAGTLTAHLINASGCDSEATLILSVYYLAATSLKTDAGCYGSATGSITITPTNGVGPYSYRIGTVGAFVSSNTFNNLKAGKYRISMLDANGCLGVTSQITIAQKPALTANIVKTDASCNGASDGNMTITPTNGVPPYLYKLKATGIFGSANSFSNLKAGTYQVYIQDGAGCIGNIAVVIGQPGAITATFANTNVSCNGLSDGSMTITPTNSSGPYMYRLGTTGSFQSSNVFSSLKAAAYLVYIQNGTGCTSFLRDTILAPLPVGATYTKTDASCPAAHDGSITVNGTGGVPPYSYRFGTAGSYTSTNLFTGLSSGTYSVFVKDANNCSGNYISVAIGLQSPVCRPSIVSTGRTIEQPKSSDLWVSLSPNPSSNLFSVVTHSSSLQAVTIRVWDINGRIVFQTKGQPEQTFRFGDRFANGIYLVEVTQGEVVKTLKAIKGK